jgi:hypothetical protein
MVSFSIRNGLTGTILTREPVIITQYSQVESKMSRCNHEMALLYHFVISF